MAFKEVNPQINFPDEEEKVLKFWQDNKIFEKSIEQRPKEKLYTFYDGPPFATGLPHYGHLLAGIIKDIIPRYWTMKGRRIERVFGWDCHGLPIEYEIDKKLGISGAAAVEKFGIAKYNEECRGIVLRYTAEWEKTVHRIGRWVDFKKGYKTMDASFMESVWWVFKQLWDKGLIYRGHRVMPFSWALGTTLSSSEASSNYKEVQDPAITVTFKVLEQEDASFLAWTTTPWTLPSNLALAVGPGVDYVKIYSKAHDQKYILGKERLSAYFKSEDEYDILKSYKASDLEGLTYQPLFDYFKDHKDQGAFKVILSDHVTVEDGTGIVHIAPAFGEDDFYVCQKYGIELVCPVDDDGNFTAEVTDFKGRHVKDADKDIIAMIKAKGRLFRHDTINHNYPFCWRSETPLIYKAVTSWFVKVEALKENLIKNNAETHWVPETLRDGRFGNWLENARDWNIDRNRFWGNPIPIWENNVTGEKECIGSIKKLEELSGENITDIHREFIDDIVFEKEGEEGIYKRIPSVFDCWFESGSMPYAQGHYPFENKEKFEQGFPADFIAEGLDQTRGWFYTLSVLGTALFNKLPFKNVVVNGMILAEDGKKMSKRLKNYPDPSHILHDYGADALRLYMIQSPAVRAEELRFSEVGVKEIVRRILLKWWNAYTFFISYAVIDKWQSGSTKPPLSDRILDKWIISRMQTLLDITEKEMAQYHLYNVVPALLDFIDDLTNTYIRLNRKRFWSDDSDSGMAADKNAAYATLYNVLFNLTKIMAPYTPFLAETMYENLKKAIPVGGGKESVHLEDYPLANHSLITQNLEESVALMNRVILMVRNVREKKNIKVKIPLKRLHIIHRDPALLDHLKSLEGYLKEELNIREIDYLTNEDDFVELSAKANGAVLGKRLGKKFGAVSKAVSSLDNKSLVKLEQGEMLEIEGETITKNECLIYRNARKGHENVVSDAYITVELDTTLDKDQILEGLAREVVNRIQKLRKTANLNLSDRIQVEYQAECEIAEAIQQNSDYIQEQTLATVMTSADDPKGQATEVCEIEKKKMVVALTVVN